MSLDNKNILITGAANGIGKALTIACAEQGATVLILDKDVAALEALYDQIVEEGYAEPILIPMDLLGATPDDYQKLAEQFKEQDMHLHSVILNAAQLGTLTPIEHYEIKQWYNILQVNLNANFLMIHALLPILKTSDNPKIIFSSDMLTQYPKAYWGAYSVSKAALENFAQILREELETNAHIEVHCIRLGPVDTKLRQLAYPAEDKSLLKTTEDAIGTFLDILY